MILPKFCGKKQWTSLINVVTSLSDSKTGDEYFLFISVVNSVLGLYGKNLFHIL